MIESDQNTVKIALFRHIAGNFNSVFQYHEGDEARWNTRPDYVQISDPVEVTFSPLMQDDVIQKALASLDAKAQEVRIECEKQLAEINKTRAQFLALAAPAAPAEAA